MCMLIEVPQEFPMWVLIFERLGPGSCILIFTGAVLWKLLPASTRLLGAWRKQSEKITASVDPVLDGVRDAVQHLERIADHVTGTGTPLRGAWGAGVRGRGPRPDPSGPGGSAVSKPE